VESSEEGDDDDIEYLSEVGSLTSVLKNAIDQAGPGLVASARDRRTATNTGIHIHIFLYHTDPYPHCSRAPWHRYVNADRILSLKQDT
jgi:hypothetical protein